MLRTPFLCCMTALAYVVCGWASLQLAIPPDYVAMVFIPAGVALGAVLVAGYRVLPGVALGAILVQWLAHVQSNQALGAAMLVPPLGATAMAGLTTWGIRRWVGYPTALDEPRQALLTFFVLIPGGTLLNASMSVPTLVWAGVLPANSIGFSWLTWWLADTLGAVVFTPLLLVALGAPADAWRPRWRTVALPMALALGLMSAGLWLLAIHQRQSVQNEIEQTGTDLSLRLQHRLDAQLDSLETMSLLLGMSDTPSPKAFDAAAALWLERYPGTHSFGWSPKLEHRQRHHYESVLPGRPIRSRTLDGQTPPAAQAPHYYPLHWVTPLQPNQGLLGLDVSTLPRTAAAVRSALTTDRPQATEAVPLVTGQVARMAVVVFQSVRPDTGKAAIGLASAVFLLDDLVQSFGTRQATLCLVDHWAPAGWQRLAGPEGCEQVQPRAGTAEPRSWPLHFAGREWSLRILPSPQELTSWARPILWGSTTVALLAVSMLGAFLIVITGQSRRTARLVDERTHELAMSNASLLQLAHFDGLTGLANRAFWTQQAEATLTAARHNGQQVAVLFLDLDRFKHVNDSLGHSQGDQLLVSVSARIQACLRARDVLARLGGDEFVALLPWVRDTASAATVARKIALALAEPVLLDGMQVTVTGSIGLALYPEHGHNVEELLRHADTAMYAAKAAGRNQYRFFESAMHDHVSRRLSIESGLRLALELNAPELSMAYQPQVDARTHRVLGVEALLRWQHPVLGSLSPDEFIPIAEEAGLIEPLGQWVLQTVCRQIQAWADGPHATVFAPLTVAVNVSAPEFNRPHFLQHLEEARQLLRQPAGRLDIEITESLLIHASPDVSQRMTRITELGMGLSLDDFGTGYSSLGYLKRLPLSKLKIDRSFVLDVPGDPEGEAIIRAMLSMAHDLGLSVVAEGVETEAQRDFLRQHGCDALQGWLYARAMPADALENWLLQHPQT